jgi:hypothetical protein
METPCYLKYTCTKKVIPDVGIWICEQSESGERFGQEFKWESISGEVCDKEGA